MNIAIPILIILAVPIAAASQTLTRSSACPQDGGQADDIVVTICTHERGMVVLPQPQLYLRVFRSGNAEYETGAPFKSTDRAYKLIKKNFVLTDEELAEITQLATYHALQQAKDDYPLFRRWTDSSIVTTVTVGGKQIVVRNFSEGDRENKDHYPAPLTRMLELAHEIHDRVTGVVREVPNIDFCTLTKDVDAYLGQKVSTYADLEYHANMLANLKILNEREILYDHECEEPRMDAIQKNETFITGYVGKPAEIHANKVKTQRVRGLDFGGRGRVLLTGKLVLNSGDQSNHKYRFDISKVGTVEKIILPYQGTLKNGWLYSDTFDYDRNVGLVLSSPLKIRAHYATRIEWKNERQFSTLQKSGRKHIIFRVVSETVQKIDANRWDSTWQCEIVELVD